jgi:hypothetical protein
MRYPSVSPISAGVTEKDLRSYREGEGHDRSARARHEEKGGFKVPREDSLPVFAPISNVIGSSLYANWFISFDNCNRTSPANMACVAKPALQFVNCLSTFSYIDIFRLLYSFGNTISGYRSAA